MDKTEKTFNDLKSKHPDTIILFRHGDFYGSYQEDAEQVARITGVTLARNMKVKWGGNERREAAFPYHALDIYLPKLIRAGQRVAICEELQ